VGVSVNRGILLKRNQLRMGKSLTGASQSALKQGNDFIGKRVVAHGPIGAQPREGPIDHAKQHHGDGGLIGECEALWVRASQKAGDCSHDVALSAKYDFSLFEAQKLGVVQQCHVPGG
jgi:hypothetical protein